MKRASPSNLALLQTILTYANLAVSAISVPILIAKLGAPTYGVFLMFMSLYSYLMLCDAGASAAVHLLVARALAATQLDQGLSEVMRHSIVVSVTSCFVAIAAVIAYVSMVTHGIIPTLVPGAENAKMMYYLLGVYAVVNMLFIPVHGLLFGAGDGQYLVLVTGASRIVASLSSCIMALRPNPTIEMVFAPIPIATVIGNLALLSHAHRIYGDVIKLRGPIKGQHVREQYAIGIKTMAYNSGRTLSSSASIFAIGRFLGPQFVGGYSLSMTLLQMPLQLMTSWSATSTPRYGQQWWSGKRDEVRKQVGVMLQLVISWVVFCGIIFLFLASPVVELWTSGAVRPSLWIIGAAIFVASVGTVSQTSQSAFMGIGQYWLQARTEIVIGALSMALIPTGVWFYGEPGLMVSIAIVSILAIGWLFCKSLNGLIEDFRITIPRAILGRIAFVGLLSFAFTFVVKVVTWRVLSPLQPRVICAVSLSLIGNSILWIKTGPEPIREAIGRFLKKLYPGVIPNES